MTSDTLGAIYAVVVLVVDIVIRVLAVIFVPQNRKPQTAAAWLLAIFLIPYVGIILFLLIGNTRLPKSRRDKQREINEYILETTEGMDEVERDPDFPPWLDPIVELNRTLGSMPLVGGNTTHFYTEYEESLAAMTDAMTDAKRFIHVEFYILALDKTTRPFFDAMDAAIRRGVTVRVLFDHIACLRSPHYHRTLHALRRMGAIWHPMLPIQPLRGKFQRPDLRNHRKILVIDGVEAFTGSQNVIDRSYNKRGNISRGLKWKDFMARFEGPVVAGINALFVTDWYSETNELLVREARDATHPKLTHALDAQVVPSGPGFDLENNLRLFNALVYSAQRKVIITSPYFVPDDSMLYAITNAAYRGLDVQLFASEIGDQAVVYHAQRSYYEALLRAGVRIFLYKAPYILHAKHISIDDDVAVIGSSNMDMRSFSLDYEISIMMRGHEAVSRLREVEESYRVESKEITLEAWLKRPIRSKVLDNTARLTAALQ
ncbi:MAG: cls [Microbacteriaceae bacterium]|jgi:cardiolipin synthase|nr:cls [Microbacteriaceae bacterium]